VCLLVVSISLYCNNKIVGEFANKYLQEMGAKVVATSDLGGAIYNKDGLDLLKLAAAKKRGSVTHYKDAKKLLHEEIFELPVDILIPASITNVITEKNYRKIKAQIIVEAANVPIPHDIEERLHERGVLVVPDIIANAGGVISSYAEYRGYNPKDMFRMVKRKIVKNTRVILETAKMHSATPRHSAMQIAKKRVAKAMASVK